MGLINKVAGSKKFWTKDEDELLIKLANEGKTVQEIASEIDHPELSIAYRIRKLSKLDDLKAINYR